MTDVSERFSSYIKDLKDFGFSDAVASIIAKNHMAYVNVVKNDPSLLDEESVLVEKLYGIKSLSQIEQKIVMSNQEIDSLKRLKGMALILIE